MNRFIKLGLLSVVLSGHLLASDISQTKPNWPEIEKGSQALELDAMANTGSQALEDNTLQIENTLEYNTLQVENNLGEENVTDKIPDFNDGSMGLIAQEDKSVPMVGNENNPIDMYKKNKEEFLKKRKLKMDAERELDREKAVENGEIAYNNASGANLKNKNSKSEDRSMEKVLKELADIKNEMKTKDDSYKNMLNSLFEVNGGIQNEHGVMGEEGLTVADIGRTKEDKLLRDKKDKQKIEDKKREMNELTKLMLPSPKKAISIGNKYILFATYKEETLSDPKGSIKGKDTIIENEDGKTKMKSDNFNDLIGLEEELNKFSMKNKFALSDIELNEKTIKIEVGHRFGDWVLSKIEMNQIVYENTETKEIFRKFY